MKDFGTERDTRFFRESAFTAVPPRAVVGLEAEFNLLVNDRRRRPEKVFGDPSRLVRRRMIPRTGKSFQLPAGGAIYFDTGVIEVATPIVELEPGCCYRATRLLWEQIRYLRRELDHWRNRNRLTRGTPCRLRKHSSRRGWRGTADSLAQSPFVADTNAALWKMRDGRILSLRAIAAETLSPFRRRMRRISDSNILEHIAAVFAGNARSLLDFAERPETYDDVGRTIDWGRRRMRRWPRSKYEKVIHRVIAREPMRVGQKRYRVDRMNGWYQVDCREVGTRRRRTFNLDELVRLSAAKKSSAAA